MKIWKYPLRITDRQIVSMPKGAKVLSVGNQREVLCLWALVDDCEEAKEGRVVLIYGTNHLAILLGDYQYVGTVLMAGGSLVWHVFLEEVMK